MYIFNFRDPSERRRGKSNRKRAKHKAKQRRRVNRMHKRTLGRKLKRNGGR